MIQFGVGIVRAIQDGLDLGFAVSDESHIQGQAWCKPCPEPVWKRQEQCEGPEDLLVEMGSGSALVHRLSICGVKIRSL